MQEEKAITGRSGEQIFVSYHAAPAPHSLTWFCLSLRHCYVNRATRSLLTKLLIPWLLLFMLCLPCSLIQPSTSCSVVDSSHAFPAPLLLRQLSVLCEVYSTTLWQLLPHNLLGTRDQGKTTPSCKSLCNQLIPVWEYKLQRCYNIQSLPAV